MIKVKNKKDKRRRICGKWTNDNDVVEPGEHECREDQREWV